MDEAIGRNSNPFQSLTQNTQIMRANKLIAALGRTKATHVDYVRLFGTYRHVESIPVSQALTMVRERNDFMGIGTRANVRTILYSPIPKPAVHQICHRTTTGCLVFWGEQRSAA